MNDNKMTINYKPVLENRSADLTVQPYAVQTLIY